MNLKRFLFWIHRWLGIGMCGMFALWFASGVIMMYVEYPELTEQERIASLPILDTSQVRLTPIEAAASIGNERSFSSVSLLSVAGRPAYQFYSVRGSLFTVFADSGELFNGTNHNSALAAVQHSNYVSDTIEPSYDSEIILDQWTVSEGLNAHRPLHRVKLNDDADTVLYVSDLNGQIVRDTNREERFWNWLGSTVHWIYPVQLRKNAALWNDVIVYLSLIGIVSVITGGIIGIIRLRVRKPYGGTAITPYSGWMKWHHIGGLFSIVFVSTFIFSGLMSMGPWGVFNPSSSAQPQIDRYTGGRTLRLSDLPIPNYEQLKPSVKEISWLQINRSSLFVLTETADKKTVGFGTEVTVHAPDHLQQLIADTVADLLPEARLISLDLLSQADDYYYARHNRYRPLPVYRARFDDSESTWFHIDSRTGELLNRITDASRRERWLFNGLHSLDFQILLQVRPLWDILLIVLSVIGFGFSVTAVVIGWRRLVA